MINDYDKMEEREVNAKAIVRDIIKDLTNRSGLQDAFESCDVEIQQEIKDEWTRIVESYL